MVSICHVVVFGVDRGSMPHSLAEDIEWERRVFHVAITRGRESVTVLADRKRPSRFLTEIDGTAPHPVEPPAMPASSEKIPTDAVHVAVGDQLTISGGYSGTVVEVLATGVLVQLAEATMAVPGETGWRNRAGLAASPPAPGVEIRR